MIFIAYLATVAVLQSPANPDQLEGTIEVGVPPKEVLAVLADVEHWPDLFSDVRSSKRVAHPTETRMSVDTRSGGHAHDYRFITLDDGVSFEVLDAHGGNLHISGIFKVTATETGSRVEATLLTKVTGLMGVLLPDKKVRSMAKRKLEHDLGDLERRFAKKP